MRAVSNAQAAFSSLVACDGPECASHTSRVCRTKPRRIVVAKRASSLFYVRSRRRRRRPTDVRRKIVLGSLLRAQRISRAHECRTC